MARMDGERRVVPTGGRDGSRRRIGKHVRLLVGLALTALFLWLALRKVDLAGVSAALRSAHYGYLQPAALCTVAGYTVRTLRWRTILAPAKPIAFRRLFPVLMIGFATNNLLPARIGEFARAYVLGSREGVSRSTALATVVVERVCDGLTLIAMMTLTLLFFPLPVDDPRLRAVELGATAIFGLATMALIGLLLFPGPALAVARAIERPLPDALATRIERLLHSFIQGLTALRSRRALLEITGLSLLVWTLEGTVYGLVLRAFPFDLSPTEWLAASVFLLVFVNLGIMLPAAPGYIGTYQFFATLALGAFRVAPSLAIGLALVAHALQYSLITGMGLLCLWSLGLTPGRLSHLDEEEAREAGEADEVDELVRREPELVR